MYTYMLTDLVCINVFLFDSSPSPASTIAAVRGGGATPPGPVPGILSSLPPIAQYRISGVVSEGEAALTSASKSGLT